MLTGGELDELHDEALWHAAERTDLFVEVDPNQKERIILALKKMGHVVGFLGDGVNDAPAMHAADTSLSVEQAVDVAREAADFVLLERDLDVIRRGIEEGRRTFANTLKYVLTTTSANLGNMVSMAVASLFLPFLPLLAGQILLNNFLSDIPAIGIADDSVDPELVERPRALGHAVHRPLHGRVRPARARSSTCSRSGRCSGVFAAPSGPSSAPRWFVESLLTELVVALVVRTRRPFFRSRPGRVLAWSTVAMVGLAFAIPYLPFAAILGFVPLPSGVVASLVVITVLYVVAVEIVKLWFYRGGRPPPDAGGRVQNDGHALGGTPSDLAQEPLTAAPVFMARAAISFWPWKMAHQSLCSSTGIPHSTHTRMRWRGGWGLRPRSLSNKDM